MEKSKRKRRGFSLPGQHVIGAWTIKDTLTFFIDSWENGYIVATCFNDGKEWAFSEEQLKEYGIGEYYDD